MFSSQSRSSDRQGAPSYGEYFSAEYSDSGIL
jgi:hypothetical protein